MIKIFKIFKKIDEKNVAIILMTLFALLVTGYFSFQKEQVEVPCFLHSLQLNGTKCIYENQNYFAPILNQYSDNFSKMFGCAVCYDLNHSKKCFAPIGNWGSEGWTCLGNCKAGYDIVSGGEGVTLGFD